MARLLEHGASTSVNRAWNLGAPAEVVIGLSGISSLMPTRSEMLQGANDDIRGTIWTADARCRSFDVADSELHARVKPESSMNHGQWRVSVVDCYGMTVYHAVNDVDGAPRFYLFHRWGVTLNNKTSSFRAKMTLPTDRIAALCEKYHIDRLSLFGSITRDDFSPDSDVDVLVEFQPGKTPGLRFFTIQDDLSQLLGRRVDLNTPESLSVYYRDKVEAEAVPLYVRP